MSTYWSSELWRVSALAGVGALFGLLLGRPFLIAALFLFAYLLWYMLNLVRLSRWLRGGAQPPDVGGLWGRVFRDFNRLQQRQRRKRERMSRLLDRFRETTAAMPDAAVVLGEDYEIQWWNDAAATLLGLRPSDSGRRISSLLRNPVFVDFIEHGDHETAVEFSAPADENRIVSARLVPYGDKPQYLLLARDVTSHLRLEQIRRDFMANVSHELRTPLTVVVGYLEALHDAEDEGLRPWRRELDVMHQQTGRMRHLVEDLLLLSRLESTSLAALEIVAVPEMLAGLKKEAAVISGEKEHAITLDADPDLYLRGSRKELESAFANLIINAIRYTPAGGRIDLRWYREGNHAGFSVSDTGIGIPATHIPRLTERFYRVDVGRSRDSGGTGLGLAIVKHVLKRHRAELRIESQVGQGSTFACLFPDDATVERKRRSAAKPAAPAKGSTQP